LSIKDKFMNARDLKPFNAKVAKKYFPFPFFSPFASNILFPACPV